MAGIVGEIALSPSDRNRRYSAEELNAGQLVAFALSPEAATFEQIRLVTRYGVFNLWGY